MMSVVNTYHAHCQQKFILVQQCCQQSTHTMHIVSIIHPCLAMLTTDTAVLAVRKDQSNIHYRHQFKNYKHYKYNHLYKEMYIYIQRY